MIALYLLYCLLWDGGILGGCAYLVFWRGASGWWFLLAMLFVSAGGFRTASWDALVARRQG